MLTKRQREVLLELNACPGGVSGRRYSWHYSTVRALEDIGLVETIVIFGSAFIRGHRGAKAVEIHLGSTTAVRMTREGRRVAAELRA